MTKQLILASALLVCVLSLNAQSPRNVKVESTSGEPSGLKMECNDAGTIQFGRHTGQSNDVSPDTIFLCFEDSLEIIHNRDFDLSGDPNPNTPPGIVYAFYDSIPTVPGPDLATLQTDPSLNTTSPIFPPNGPPLEQDQGVWITSGNRFGDVTFSNSGFLQIAFNSGLPVQFWFAPLTIDDFENGLYEEAPNQGPPSGPCISAKIDEAFSVVYLNPIQINDLQIEPGNEGCLATFNVRGGLPEFDPNTAYDLDIRLQDDPQTKATIVRQPLGSGDEVSFRVPKAGVYDIVISDGKSCAGTTSIDMTGCKTVNFRLPLRNVQPADQVCLDVEVSDFQGVGFLDGSINWDSTILRFNSVQNIHPTLQARGMTVASNFGNPNLSSLTFSWQDAGLSNVDLPDSTTIFQLCLDVIGQLGECSPVEFSSNPTNIEIGNSTPTIFGFNGTPGAVCITNEVLFVSAEQDSVSCADTPDGGFTVRVSEGTPPYKLQWKEQGAPVPGMPFDQDIGFPGGSVSIDTLPSGTYEVYIEDSNTPVPNFDTILVEVLGPPSIGVSLSTLNRPSCFNSSDGALQVEVDTNGIVVNNPTEFFDFRWNVPGADGPVLDSIPSGTYSVTVTSKANDCFEVAQNSLSMPPPIDVTPNVTVASCSGIADGEVTLTVTGGTSASGDYTIDWPGNLGSDVANTSTRSNLTPGEYCVTITDDSGCQLEECIDVGASKTLSVDGPITDVTCNGGTDGALFVTGNTDGASPETPYSFSWDGPIPLAPTNTNTTSELENLPAGAYTVTMTDAGPAGCQVVDSFMVQQPEPISIRIVDRQDESCNVGNDGAASLVITGGTGPYDFAWSNGVTDSIATGLSAGTYSVTVEDVNNCIDSMDVTIFEPTPPQIATIQNDTLNCPTDTDGSLTVEATPGNAPITSIEWNTGATTETITGLSPGRYTVTVTAQDQCSSIDSGFVIAPDPLQLDSVTTTSPTCAGGSNGNITVFVQGGTEPLTYSWAGNGTTGSQEDFNLIAGLAAGTYDITVEDGGGCGSIELSATVNDPPTIEITFTDTVAVSCFEGVCDGQAMAMAGYSDGSGGSFDFRWESGEEFLGVQQSQAVQLCAGQQELTVSDGDGCFTVDSVDIPSPPEILVDVDVEPVSCNSLSDGSVTLAASGGAGSFTYEWQTLGATGPSQQNLPAGNYSALITDANGCTKTQAVELTEPAPLQLSLDTERTRNATCGNDTDGVFAVTVNDTSAINPLGAAPFAWSNGIAEPSSDFAEGLGAGTYSVTVTDVKGCQDSLMHTLEAPDPIEAVIPQPQEPRCFGESTILFVDTVFGGNGMGLSDYTYSINQNGLDFAIDQPATVFAGQQVVTITDPLGCTLTDTLQIDQPEELSVTFASDEIVLELGDSVQLDPIITSSLPVDSFGWFPTTDLRPPNVQNPIVDPLESQEYELMISDINGCTASGSIFVRIDRNRNIYIPNVFSPNGDAQNEEFRIFACKGVEEIVTARIFDRWGNLVAQVDNLLPVCDGGTILWDGTWQAEDAGAGVFVYMIQVKFLDGQELTYRGDLTLLR